MYVYRYTTHTHILYAPLFTIALKNVFFSFNEVVICDELEFCFVHCKRLRASIVI